MIKHEKTRGRPDMIREDGSRVFIHPTEVKGFFKSSRNVVQLFLIILLLVLPWLKPGGKQAFLIDIVHRKFVFFGHLFFAQDVPLLFLVLVNFVLVIALTTALWGRVWCGWACPQTVFIEGIFRRIERWVEGRAEERRKRDQASPSFDRTARRVLKWFLFSVVTLWVTHSLLALFMGSDQVLKIIGHPIGEHTTAFLFILISNLVLLFDFGWFREQFCMIACPYGKFQSVLHDPQTVTVAYQASRGEPRRPGAGDCVDCGRCVSVCPTGIDIRRGMQLECIACTACIDACDDVMERLHKPKHLIGYFAEKSGWFRPRIVIYASLLMLFGSVMVWKFSTLKTFEIVMIKAKGEPYRMVNTASGTEVLNVFNVELTNKNINILEVRFVGVSDDRVKLVMPNNPLQLQVGQVTSNPMTVEFKKEVLSLGSADFNVEIQVKDLETGQIKTAFEKLHVIGPF